MDFDEQGKIIPKIINTKNIGLALVNKVGHSNFFLFSFFSLKNTSLSEMFIIKNLI